MMACSRCGKLIPGEFTTTESVLCRECAAWSAHFPGEISIQQERYTGFDPPIWMPMEISFTLKEPLTDAQIDALFPLDQLGDDPRWVEAINKMKETNRRARENGKADGVG